MVGAGALQISPVFECGAKDQALVASVAAPVLRQLLNYHELLRRPVFVPASMRATKREEPSQNFRFCSTKRD